MTFWDAIKDGVATREAIENLLVLAFARYADDQFFGGKNLYIGGKIYRFEDAIQLRAKGFLDAEYFDPSRKSEKRQTNEN